MDSDWAQKMLSALKAPTKSGGTAVQSRLNAFTPPLCLNFLRGPRADDCVILGYGPRVAGFFSLDIFIPEASTPDDLFILIPGGSSNKGPLFRTNYPKLIKVNGLETSDHNLQDGDTVQIGNTVIRFEFLED